MKHLNLLKGLGGFASETSQMERVYQDISPTLREQLEQRKQHYSEQIDEINKFLELLEQTPNFEQLLDLLQKMKC